MSFSKVQELRKADKLKEAEELSAELLKKDPENIWNKRAASWVIYDYLKKYASAKENYDEFITYLTKLKNLKLPEDEKMVFDNLLFKIGKMVYNLQDGKTIEYSKIDKVFDLIKDFHFTKPSDGYSFLHKAFLKTYKHWSRYIEFADWWDLNYLRDDDYKRETYNGRELPSLAEKIYIAYPKLLLEFFYKEQDEERRKSILVKIKDFIPNLNNIINNNPDYHYAIYYKTKLLLVTGSKEMALESFLPFLKKKQNDFWVWELLGDMLSDNIDVQLSCYCKALLLRTKEEFLINTRENLAELLIQRNLLPEAKTEIDKAISTRVKSKWKLTNRLKKWQCSTWYNSIQASEDNTEFYKKHVAKSAEVIYKNIPEVLVVVEYINADKHILNYIKSKDEYGFFNYHPHLSDPKIGDILKVRFAEKESIGFQKVLTLKKSDDTTAPGVLRNFEGQLKLISDKNMGFVDDVFIEPKLIKENKLLNKQYINGRALLSYNKKKDFWGWKAINISL